jgi:Lipase (class 3)
MTAPSAPPPGTPPGSPPPGSPPPGSPPPGSAPPRTTGLAPVQVIGGAGGIDAHLDDMETAAGLIGRVGLDVTEAGAAGHRYLAEPDVAASAVLDPSGAARFEAAMLRALDGEHGVARTGIRIGASAVKLKAAAVTYRAKDEAQAAAMHVGEFVAAPFTFAGSLGEAGVLTGWHLLHGESVSQALQETLTDHPGILDQTIGAMPGLLTDLAVISPAGAAIWAALGAPITVPQAAAGLAQLYPDGRPKVTDLGPDDAISAKTPPRNLTDVMRGLNARNNTDKSEIDVRTVETRMPDGSIKKSYIVDIPGTRVWNGPGFEPNINDLGTNLHAVGNEVTSYEKAVEDALARAGVQPGDPVMLVGHSQGGIVAAHSAADFVNSGKYNVTNVVTAGSPVGEIDIPKSVQVLSIENSHDIVPHLDSASNPDQSNRTTVIVDNQTGTIGNNHGIGTTYLPAAQGVDASTDPSVRAYLESADGFFHGDTVTTTQYGVERTP